MVREAGKCHDLIYLQQVQFDLSQVSFFFLGIRRADRFQHGIPKGGGFEAQTSFCLSLRLRAKTQVVRPDPISLHLNVVRSRHVETLNH